MHAVANGSVPLVRMLLKVNIRGLGYEGWVLRGWVVVRVWWGMEMASVSAVTPAGTTVLLHAVANGSVPLVRMLLKVSIWGLGFGGGNVLGVRHFRQSVVGPPWWLV
jgi:ankyrin repeat protein